MALIANWNKKWAGQFATLHLIEKMTRVEDTYGKEVDLGSSSQSGNVYQILKSMMELWLTLSNGVIPERG